jgi:serine/threonine protein kinase
MQSARSTETGKHLMAEASRMRSLQHPNIVQLLGVCFRTTPSFIVLQYMPRGDLKTYLRRCRDSMVELDPAKRSAHLTLFHQLRLALDVATGAAYLAGQGFVHRDLAARNILLDLDWSAKIADFGIRSSVVCCADY